MQVAPTLSSCPDARLQAVASRDAAKLSEFRSLSGKFIPHESNASLIHAPAVDTICLPLHRQLHTRAMCIRDCLMETVR